MASSREFVDFASGQLSAAGEITSKRMFGEYGLYCDGLFFAVICDNQLFIKPTEAGRDLFPDLPLAPPYAGAKDYLLIDDLDDKEHLAELARATCAELAQKAKPKKKAEKKAGQMSQEEVNQKQPAFDYKKEYKEFYLPKRQPGLIEVPPMQFAAVRGQGDPNQEGGAYQQAISWLYAAAYAVKMSKKGDYRMAGYFDFVVPPLEGLWWQQDADGQIRLDFAPGQKENLHWLALIRLPDFVSEADFAWAAAKAAAKQPQSAGRLELFRYTEGLCVQCLHVGPYDNEPATVAAMRDFAAAQGYALDEIKSPNEQLPVRRHHEIYLSDPRRCKPENMKTVIRLPLVAQRNCRS